MAFDVRTLRGRLGAAGLYYSALPTIGTIACNEQAAARTWYTGTAGGNQASTGASIVDLAAYRRERGGEG
jgi:hypothetical protein